MDQANDKRGEAMQAVSDGEWDYFIFSTVECIFVLEALALDKCYLTKVYLHV